MKDKEFMKEDIGSLKTGIGQDKLTEKPPSPSPQSQPKRQSAPRASPSSTQDFSRGYRKL